ncbi:MAG: hypothetical protein AVW06_01225 [Hadesarchaea archaeon DG-33-1]|nr:MAG: hypothetical protein AVW06_01225 [Hadesarchaea archaeon DG-33-1]
MLVTVFPVPVGPAINVEEPLKKKYKYIVLDSAPGLSPEVIAAVKASDELLVITNPEVPTIATTLRTFRAAERYKIPVTGVVVNKIRGKRYEVPTSQIRKTLGWPIVGLVPDDDKVRESLTVGIRELGKHLLEKWTGRRRRSRISS